MWVLIDTPWHLHTSSSPPNKICRPGGQLLWILNVVYQLVKSHQLTYRLGSRRRNLRISHLQISGSNLIKMTVYPFSSSSDGRPGGMFYSDTIKFTVNWPLRGHGSANIITFMGRIRWVDNYSESLILTFTLDELFSDILDIGIACNTLGKFTDAKKLQAT